MNLQARYDAGETWANSSLRLAFVSIWVYALAAGLVALGLTEVIAALTQPSAARSSLQLATMLIVAVVAGLACERTLTSLRSVFAFRSRDKQATTINDQ
jgi:hypothetical protein